MIEVQVAEIGAEMNSNSPVVILSRKEGSGILPMKIDSQQAVAIYIGLKNKKLPRPMTHDLLKNVIDKCNLEVLKVEVVALKEGTYYAEIIIKENDEVVKIDARPSDAIALALRKDVSIYLAEDIAEDNFIYGDPQEFVEPYDFKIM